jgi:hypothetical protein
MQEKTDVILPKNSKDEHVKCQDFQMGTEEREGTFWKYENTT